eukprot:3352143-Pyramimonas_sp.AAC.1
MDWMHDFGIQADWAEQNLGYSQSGRVGAVVGDAPFHFQRLHNVSLRQDVRGEGRGAIETLVSNDQLMDRYTALMSRMMTLMGLESRLGDIGTIARFPVFK